LETDLEKKQQQHSKKFYHVRESKGKAMKTIGIALILLVYCSCNKPKPQVVSWNEWPRFPVATTKISTSTPTKNTIMPMPMDSKAVELIKKEAIARHLHLSISCNEDPTADAFTGEMWTDKGNNTYNPIFVEEGGIPSWTAWGNTQDSVARQLLSLVKGQPNFYPKHKRSAIQHRQCPEPIHM